MRSREQKFAEHAWRQVCDMKPEVADTFSKACKKTMARVLSSGLAPAGAFTATRKQDGYPEVLSALTTWFSDADQDGLKWVEALIKKPSAELRRDTDAALCLLQWLARLAEAIVAKEEVLKKMREKADAGN